MSKIYILLLCLTTMVSSCSNDDYYSADGTGTVVFQDFDVDANFTNVNTESRTESVTERNVVNNDFKNGFSISMMYHDEVVYSYVMPKEDIDKIVPPEGSEVSPVDWTDLMKPVKLRAGNYMINVNFSSLEKEGFEMPCYTGSKEIILKKDETLTVDDILCVPANSKFGVTYTDAFKNYFSDYSFSIVTERGNEVVFAKDESRTAYISPGKSDLYVTVEREGQNKAKYKIELKKSDNQNPDDKEDSAEDISNGIFKAGREYSVTLDVNVGTSTMTVTFSENFGTENVSIDVSHSAFNANPPILTPNGFENNIPLEFYESEVDDLCTVAVNAEGLIKECNLTTTSKFLLEKGWPKTVDLASTSEEEKQKQQKIADLGLITKGFGVNIDQMAYLDFTNVIKSVRGDDNVEIKIEVIDKYTKTSDPFSLLANIKSCGFGIKAANEKAKFLGNECKVDLSFFKGEPKNVEFFLTEESGDKKLDVKDIQKVEEPSEDGKEHHIVTLKASDDVKFINPFDVKAKYLDYDIIAKSIPVSIGILIDNEADVWAKRAYIHVYNDDMKNLKVQRFDGNNWVDVVTEITQDRTNFLLAKELPSETKCQFRVLKGEQEVTNVIEAITEKKLQVPNAGFEEWYFEQPQSNWKRWFPWNKDVQETMGWNTLNLKTTSDEGCFAPNFAYVNNSGTIETADCNSGSKAALIRTVGWGDGSTAPGKFIGTWDGEMKKQDSGYLYLGENSNDPEVSYTPFSFISRPSKVSFYYKYRPASGRKVSDDNYEIIIKVENRDDNQIRTLANVHIKEGGKTEQYTYKEVNIDYSKDLNFKATHIYILFKSGTEKRYDYFLVPPYNNLSDGEYIGSQLYIDDIQLIYE